MQSMNHNVNNSDGYCIDSRGRIAWLQEDLYEEDMRVKVRAVARIASLFREADNAEALLAHESLLPTLARMLREDGKRSMDLCIHIAFVFFSLSNFSDFHALVCDNQVSVQQR